MIREIEVGTVKVERFKVDDDWRAWKNGVPAGEYTRLLINGRLYMSDTPQERRDNWRIMREANGNVLIAGLGLGMILPDVLERASTVTVIEKNADVVAAIAPNFPEVEVVHADIFTWKPTRKYDVIYFDIWPDKCTDNLEQITHLNRRFGRWLNRDNPNAWIDSWARTELIVRKRRESRWGY